MTTTTSDNEKSDGGTAKSTSPISDDEANDRGLVKLSAFVREELLISKETKTAKKESQAKSNAERKRAQSARNILEQRDQLNILTSVFEDKRATMMRAGLEIEDDTIHAAIDAVIAPNPKVRNFVLSAKDKPDEALDAATVALANPGIVGRGLRTLKEDVAALVDAVLVNESVRRFCCIIVDKIEDETNIEANANNSVLLRIMEAIAGHPELCRWLATVMADRKLLLLLSAITRQSEFRRVVEIAEKSPAARSIICALADQPATVERVQIAIKQPNIVDLGTRACKSADIKRAVEFAIASPRAVHIGRKVLSLLQGRGWMARRLLKLISDNSQPQSD